MSSSLKGYVLGILAAAFYGTNPLFAVPLYAEGLSPDSVLFWRYLFAIPIMGLLMVSRHESFRIRSLSEGVLLAAAGILVGLSSATLFIAYQYMDVGIASTLLFLYPVMVALIMAVRYHERLSRQAILCLLGTMAGIALLGKTSSGQPLSIVGVLLVGASSLSYALYIVGANRSALSRISSMKTIFYVLVFGIFVFLVPLAFNGNFRAPATAFGWFNALGLAVFPTALSFWLITLSIHYIGSTRAAILGAFEPVTGVLISVFVFGGILSLREVAGIILILTSVTLLTAGPLIRQAIAASATRLRQ